MRHTEHGTALERLESRRDVFASANFDNRYLKTHRLGRGLDVADLDHASGIAGIGQYRQSTETGYDLSQEFNSLTGKISLLVGEAGGIAGRSLQTWNETGADRIADAGEHNRNHGSCLPGRQCCGRSHGNNDVGLDTDEFGRDFAVTFVASLRPAILHRDVAALESAQLV